MDTAAERFAAFSTSLTIDRVPDQVVDSAKLHILDALGCGLAAKRWTQRRRHARR